MLFVTRLKTLGALELTGADGRPILSVLAGPKRVALLVYLAIEGAGGMVRRDALLPIFWPESDAERARASLRSALVTLRRSLGDGVIVTRGDDEVGIAESKVWCDAVAFRQALDARRTEEALELYKGDLLQGFFLSEAPDFERWLDRTRSALRQQAAEAAFAFARWHEDNENTELAARWAARASELEPEDEAMLRRRLELLERIGNRTGALRLYDDFSRQLAQDFDTQPSPKTQALVHAMRVREAGVEDHAPSAAVMNAVHTNGARPAPPRVSAPQPEEVEVLPVPAPAAATTETPAPTTAPAPQVVLRTPPRYVLWAVATVLVLAVTLGALWAFWQRDPPPDPAVSTRIAVFPFSVRGADTLAYLGEGMVDLLSTKLDGIDDLQPVDPRAVLGLMASERVEYLDPERARALAARLEAGHYVLGNILEAGGRLHLTASLYDPKGNRETTAQVAVQDESHLFDLVDQLTAQLIAGQSRGPAAELTRLAALTTSSLGALKAYLRGERSFRQQRYGEAIESLQQALKMDSAFALAAYRLSIVADWAGEWDLASEALNRAVRFRSELPPHDRLLVEGLLAYNVAAPADAERRYRAALSEQPADVEAWYRLGELQFHDYPLIGLWPEQSRAAFERVLALDPEHEPARTHLARLAVQRRDRAALDSLLPQLLATKPADSLEWQHLRAFATGDRSTQRRLAAGYRALPDSLLLALAQQVATYTRDPEGAAGMTRHLLGPGRSPEARVAGHILLAYLELARGRPSAAARELDGASRLNPGAALAYRALFSTLYFLPVGEAQLRAVRDSLAAWRGNAPANPYLSLYSGLGEPDREYLLGLLSARLGEQDAVARHVAALQRLAPQSPHPNRVPRHLLRPAAVRAGLAAQLGDTAAALGLLEERYKGTHESLFASVNYFQRHLRPGLLRALGREEEALRWYGAAPWTGSPNTEDALSDIVHLAPFHLRQAEILERTGRRREAAQHYRRFIELWQDADPALRPRVDEARRHLAQLR